MSFADASFDNRSFDGENSDFGDGGDLPTASNEFQFENADGNAVRSFFFEFKFLNVFAMQRSKII